MIQFIILCGVFIGACVSNEYLKTHYELGVYCQFLTIASGFLLAWHGVNSGLNSKVGAPYINNKKEEGNK